MIMKPNLLSCSRVSASTLLAVSLASPSATFGGQHETDFFDLTLESLSRVIVSASKQEESLFDAPMAANVITGDQILRSGATSIPEALRLVPGVIVRETLSGSYDVHIRGLDNVPPNGAVVRNTINNLTLVKIDNRVVYNHSTGGTFWEMLPVSIIDIDRIEVVKGAASALYGPNAITGVIHIFSKDPEKTSRKLAVNGQAGSHNTFLLDGESGFKLGEWSGRVSANIRRRDRQSDCYIQYTSGECKSDPADITRTIFVEFTPLPDADEKYPDIDNAEESEAVNLFLAGEAFGAKNVASLNIQQTEAQRVYDDNAATPITSIDGESWALSLNSDWGKWKSHISYESGEYETLGSPDFDTDFTNMDFNLDGNYEMAGYTLQPLLQWRMQKYDGGAFANEESMDIISAGLRVEKRINDWRWSAAWRGDHYDFSSETEESYFAGLTYKGFDKLLLRASIARSAQEPFMRFVFEDITFPTSVGSTGNPDIDVVIADNVELGARWIINDNYSLDVEFFNYQAEQYQDLVCVENCTEIFVPIASRTQIALFKYFNTPVEAELEGVTINLIYSAKNFSGNFFITSQDTELDNTVYERSDFPAEASSAFDAGLFALQQNFDDNENTPEYYGGFNLNYTGFDNINLNVSGYFFDESTQVIGPTSALSSNAPPNPAVVDNTVDEVDSKWIINTKVDYRVSKELTAFVNLRNLFDDDDREFGLGDEVGATVLVGFNWTMK